MLIRRTLDRTVKGSILTGAVLCPLARHINLIVLVNPQKAVAPTRYNLRTVD